jgi:hypothetical protein
MSEFRIIIKNESKVEWKSNLKTGVFRTLIVKLLKSSGSSSYYFKSLTLRLLMSYIYTERLFLMFLDHTQRRTTLDEWSARRRDLYLTTHDTHNRQISMPRWESNQRSRSIPTGGMDICLLWVSCVVRCRSPAAILGSIPTGGMDICLLWVSCVVR